MSCEFPTARECRTIAMQSDIASVVRREIKGAIIEALCAGCLHADWYSRPEHDVTLLESDTIADTKSELAKLGFNVTIKHYKPKGEYKTSRTRVHISWEDDRG